MAYSENHSSTKHVSMFTAQYLLFELREGRSFEIKIPTLCHRTIAMKAYKNLEDCVIQILKRSNTNDLTPAVN